MTTATTPTPLDGAAEIAAILAQAQGEVEGDEHNWPPASPVNAEAREGSEEDDFASFDVGAEVGGEPLDDEAPPAGFDPSDPVLLRCAQEPLNDIGNSRRLRARWGEDMLFVPNLGWHCWDKRRWLRAENDEDAVRTYAHRTAEAIPMRILSLGAGVQSTTMALMAAHGEIGPMPDCAIFADTGDEPADVYRHLEWLMSPNVLPFPVYITGLGRLSDALMAGDDEARIPCYVGAGGLSRRQCTRNFKIRPIRRFIRGLLGAGVRGRIAGAGAEIWIGISTDEAIRMRPSGVRYITNRHPLIEKWMSRKDCVSWLRAHDYPVPPKSACIYCGFQGNAGWRRRKETPADWDQVISLDRWLREPAQVARFRGELYLHPSRIPLDQADISAPEIPLFGGLFAHECEGMCGQ